MRGATATFSFSFFTNNSLSCRIYLEPNKRDNVNAFKRPEVGEEFELFENGNNKPMHRLRIIGVTTHLDGGLDLITEDGAGAELKLCYNKNTQVLEILNRNPVIGAIYSLKPVQPN